MLSGPVLFSCLALLPWGERLVLPCWRSSRVPMLPAPVNVPSILHGCHSNPLASVGFILAGASFYSLLFFCRPLPLILYIQNFDRFCPSLYYTHTIYNSLLFMAVACPFVFCFSELLSPINYVAFFCSFPCAAWAPKVDFSFYQDLIDFSKSWVNYFSSWMKKPRLERLTCEVAKLSF